MNVNRPFLDVCDRMDRISGQTPPVHPGQSVRRKTFTDAAGRLHAAVEGLTVESVRLVPGVSIPDYWRCTAVGPGRARYEGAVDRFFEVVP